MSVQVARWSDEQPCHTFIHLEHGGKGLLGVIQGAIAVVQDTDAVPQLRILLRGYVKGMSGVAANTCCGNEPLDWEGSTRPAGMQHMPFADHPALGNNDLRGSEQEAAGEGRRGTHRGRTILRRDRKSTRLNSSHSGESRMPSSA